MYQVEFYNINNLSKSTETLYGKDKQRIKMFEPITLMIKTKQEKKKKEKKNH